MSSLRPESPPRAGLSRRSLLGRVALAAVAWPLVRLGSALASVDPRRRRRLPRPPTDLTDIWIGHC